MHLSRERDVSVVRDVRLICDGIRDGSLCQRQSAGAPTLTAARRHIINRDWIRDGKRDLCPLCAVLERGDQ